MTADCPYCGGLLTPRMDISGRATEDSVEQADGSHLVTVAVIPYHIQPVQCQDCEAVFYEKR